MGKMPVFLDSAGFALDCHNVLGSHTENQVAFLPYFPYTNPPYRVEWNNQARNREHQGKGALKNPVVREWLQSPKGEQPLWTIYFRIWNLHKFSFPQFSLDIWLRPLLIARSIFLLQGLQQVPGSIRVVREIPMLCNTLKKEKEKKYHLFWNRELFHVSGRVFNKGSTSDLRMDTLNWKIQCCNRNLV